MKTLSLKAEKRENLGKKSTAALRAKKHVPCVIYGGEENIHFHIHGNDLKNLVYTDQIFVVEIDVNGTIYKSIMKDIQFHPVKDDILHIDFIQVFDDKPSIVALPVKLTGNSIGILSGGKLRLKKRYLKAKGLIKDMPESLVIDITKLKIGDSLKINDLSYENLELIENGQTMVVGIATSRLAAKGGAQIVQAEE